MQRDGVHALEKVLDQRVSNRALALRHSQAGQRLRLLSGQLDRQAGRKAGHQALRLALPLLALYIRAHRHQHGLAHMHDRARPVRDRLESQSGANVRVELLQVDPNQCRHHVRLVSSRLALAALHQVRRRGRSTHQQDSQQIRYLSSNK